MGKIDRLQTTARREHEGAARSHIEHRKHKNPTRQNLSKNQKWLPLSPMVPKSLSKWLWSPTRPVCGQAKGACMGHRCSHVNEAANLFPMDQLVKWRVGGLCVGSRTGGGVFVLGFNDDPYRTAIFNYYYKMGSGPLYVFYTPYHLCHFEVPISIARAALFEDAIVSSHLGERCVM
jgi:hypothetical protein